MDASRRQKKVASLIKETLGRIFVQDIQDSSSGIITITEVRISPDLKTAYVFLTVFGEANKEELLKMVNERKGFLRRAIATHVKLKYNPTLIFSLDPRPEFESKIDRLIELTRKNEK